MRDIGHNETGNNEEQIYAIFSNFKKIPTCYSEKVRLSTNMIQHHCQRGYRSQKLN